MLDLLENFNELWRQKEVDKQLKSGKKSIVYSVFSEDSRAHNKNQDDDEYYEDDYDYDEDAEDDEDLDDFVEDDDYDDDDSFIDYDFDEDNNGFVSRPKNLKNKKFNKKRNKNKKNKQDAAAGIDIPSVVGKNYTYDNAICAFLNLVCEALSIDKSIPNELNLIKKSALRVIGFNLYNEEAKIKPSFVVLELHEIVCDECNTVSTVDVFRSFNNDIKGWVCDCGSLFDKSFIENKLIDWLQKNVDYYMTQDMYCKDCKMVKMDYMNKLCECGGVFVKARSSIQTYFESELNRNFNNFQKLAQCAKLPILEYYVQSFTAMKIKC